MEEILPVIPSPVSNKTNEKELFLPITRELSKFITCSICLPNNEYWYKLAFDLSEAGFIVISGLARGIDTAANSVIYKNYPTIAVTASGIDVVYPKENFDLYKKITENGGLYQFPLHGKHMDNNGRKAIMK